MMLRIGTEFLVENPRIFGIVNITSDSFSDGGKYLEEEKAIQHAFRLIQDGADVIDLGPAASNPDAEPVSTDEEIRRVAKVIQELGKVGATISIDSHHPETQKFAMQKGVAYLNDIRGFAHPEFYSELANGKSQLVLMHSIQNAEKADRTETVKGTIVERIDLFFTERIKALERAGVARDRIILDPGMGFFLGSNPEPSIEVLRAIPRWKDKFDLPILISVSRKSFLRKITGSNTESLGAATLSAELYALAQGVDFIRTHDVKALRDALAVFQTLQAS